MNKRDLIDVVAEKTGMTKKAAGDAIEAVFGSIIDSMKAGEKVQLAGFGTFSVKCREAKVGRNPRTNEEITIPASKRPAFVAGKALKEIIG